MIYVMLPAFNEEKGIGAVLDKLSDIEARLPEKFRIVVVDDGSRDRTSEIVSSYGHRMDIRLFRFDRNRGVSEVFKTGLSFVVQNSANPDHDVCVVLDSDNTQDPALILTMAERVRQGADIVIASRFEGEGRMIGCPWLRQMFSFVVSWLMRTIVRLPGVKDYSTFYRAYRVRVLKEGFEAYGDNLLAGQGFAAIGAFLIRLGNLTQKIEEIPFILRYDLKQGASGIKLFKTIRGYFELMCDCVKTQNYRKVMRRAAVSR